MGDPNKIFLGGVSFTTTEDTLSNYLGKYGTVMDVVIMRDKYTGQSRGFGFATFTEPEGWSDPLTANAVMTNLTLFLLPLSLTAAEKALADSHQIDGRKIEVRTFEAWFLFHVFNPLPS